METGNLKKNIYIGIWIFILVIFRTSVCVYWDIKGVSPDILFVFVICFAVLEKSFSYCVAVPVVCGFIMDTLAGRTMFLSVLLFSLSALITYAAGEHFFKEKIAFAMPCVFVFTFISEFLLMLLSMGTGADMVREIKSVILPAALYNTAMTAVIYPMCKFTLCKKVRRELIKKVRKRY